MSDSTPAPSEHVEEAEAIHASEDIMHVNDTQPIVEPESLIEDLDLSLHTEGNWPSSKNVSQ